MGVSPPPLPPGKHEGSRAYFLHCNVGSTSKKRVKKKTWKKLPLFFIRWVTVLFRLLHLVSYSDHSKKNSLDGFDIQNPPSLVQIQLSWKSTNQTTHPSAVAAVAAVDAPDAFAALMHIGELTQCDVTCRSWILTRKNTCLCRFIWL